MEKTGGGVLFRMNKLFLYLKPEIMFKAYGPTFDITFNINHLLIMETLFYFTHKKVIEEGV